MPAGPPPGWVITTWLAVGFALLYVICAAALAAVRLELPDPDRLAGSPTLLGGLLLLSLGWLVSIVGTLITLALWNRATRRVAEAHGADGQTYLRHWYVRMYGVSAVVTLYLLWGQGASARTVIVAGALIRAIGGLVLVAGVLIGRARILGLIADSARQTRAAQDRAPVNAAPPPGPDSVASLGLPPGTDSAPSPGPLPGPDPWPEQDPWPDPLADPDASRRPPLPPAPRSPRPRSSTALTAEPGDWDAHQWDPETQRDILRRRRKTEP